MPETLSARAYRLESLDIAGGLVIVIIAIDHVRDYFYFGAGPNAERVRFATSAYNGHPTG